MDVAINEIVQFGIESTARLFLDMRSAGSVQSHAAAVASGVVGDRVRKPPPRKGKLKHGDAGGASAKDAHEVKEELAGAVGKKSGDVMPTSMWADSAASLRLKSSAMQQDQRKEMNAHRDELVAGVVDVRALALKSGGGCAG